MIIYFESRRTTLVAIRTGRSRTGRTWRSCSRTLTGPTTCPGSGRLGRKRRPGCRQNWRSRPRSRWPNRAAPPYGSGAGDESSAPFFWGPPCDGRASTITCFAHIVKLHCSHCMASFKFFRRYCTPTKHPVHRFSLNNSVLKLKIPGILMPVSRYGGYRPGVGVTGLTSAEKRARIKPHSISWSGTLLLPSN